MGHWIKEKPKTKKPNWSPPTQKVPNPALKSKNNCSKCCCCNKLDLSEINNLYKKILKGLDEKDAIDKDENPFGSCKKPSM